MFNELRYDLPVDYTKIDSHTRRRVREQYCSEQQGKCMHCKHALLDDPPKEITDKKINWNLFPPNFTKYPIHLQHCHKTNMTEGAVHAYCNAVLWQYYNR